MKSDFKFVISYLKTINIRIKSYKFLLVWELFCFANNQHFWITVDFYKNSKLNKFCKFYYKGQSMSKIRNLSPMSSISMKLRKMVEEYIKIRRFGKRFLIIFKFFGFKVISNFFQNIENVTLSQVNWFELVSHSLYTILSKLKKLCSR